MDEFAKFSGADPTLSRKRVKASIDVRAARALPSVSRRGGFATPAKNHLLPRARAFPAISAWQAPIAEYHFRCHK
jgi:hypothetical protein